MEISQEFRDEANLESIFAALARSKFFSTLDLASGFHQIEIEETDRHKTAFTVLGKGLFEYCCVPFGLSNAPSVFQRLIEIVLAGLSWEIAIAYIDDIVIFSATFEQHLERLQLVFEALQKANLKLKPRKCALFRRKVCFLGHEVSKDGIRPLLEKQEAVSKFPAPRSQTEVKSFLGLVGYYNSFIPWFSTLAKPLYQLLTQEKNHFNWTPEAQKSFEILKHKISFPRFPKTLHPILRRFERRSWRGLIPGTRRR